MKSTLEHLQSPISFTGSKEKRGYFCKEQVNLQEEDFQKFICCLSLSFIVINYVRYIVGS